MSTNQNKKEILDVRLSRLQGDTPDTLRVVAQARAAMYSQPEMSDKTLVDHVDANPVESYSEKAETPMVSLDAVAEEVQASVETEQPVQDSFVNPQQPNKFQIFMYKVADVLGGVIPKRGDPPVEILRKCIFNIALITLIVSLTYIVNDMVIIPLKNQQKYNSLTELYNPDNPIQPPADFPEENYPEGISDAFKALYAQNDQIRGWMKYKDTNGKWMDINYPVMYSGDNEYYLDHDFQKARNKNGALFFDERNKLETPQDKNRVLIVYGHNMASGQMLSPLNKLLNNLNYMRSAPLISLDTLFDRRQYKVFSVMLLSTRKEDGPYFDYLRTSFADDEDFMNLVANMRARSIYDFNNVDINPDDELLVLSTCTSTSGAKFKDGRCVVVARRVREGESVAIRISDIVKNKDVIMPFAWYVNQKLTPHKYYTDSNYTIPGATYTTRNPYTPTTPTTHKWTTGPSNSYSWPSGPSNSYSWPSGQITIPLSGSNIPTDTGTTSTGTSGTTDPSGTTDSTPSGSETSGSTTETTATDPTGTETSDNPTETEPTETQPTETQPTEPDSEE